jgi:O-antigen ligase
MLSVASSHTAIYPLPVLRCAYYAFIFSMPLFEATDVGIESGLFSVPKLVGYMFIAAALLQPELCFKKPPKPFWYFIIYLGVFLGWAASQSADLASTMVVRTFSLAQMIIFFWISYNLLLNDSIHKGTVLAFGASCVLLSFIQLSGHADTVIDGERISALSHNPNNLAAILSLGLLALLGLAYGKIESDRKIALFAWIAFATLAAGIIRSGSRGAMLSVVVGIMFLITSRSQSVSKIKVTILAGLAIGALIWASYQNDAVRLRWERTFSEGSMAGREDIFPQAWEMFVEKPLLGWGPIINIVELGSRFGEPPLDTHNSYLWILTETGLLGAIPFFIGIGLCWDAAWKARHGAAGATPILMLACLFIMNLSITWHGRKVFWLVLAIALASRRFYRRKMADIAHICTGRQNAQP